MLLKRILCGFIAVSSIVGLVSASGPPVGTDTPRWEKNEQWLRRQGIATDTASLVAAALENSDAVVQSRALHVLTLREPADAIGVARKLLGRTKNPRLLETVAWSLAFLEDPGGVRLYKEIFLAEESVKDKLRLARRLADFGDSSTWPYVQGHATDEDPKTRERVASTLVSFINLGQEGSVDLLIAMAGDPSPIVRTEVAGAMLDGRYTAAVVKRFVPVLKALAEQDPAPEVRRVARSFLSVWESSSIFSPSWLDEKVVLHIQQDKDPDLSPPWYASYDDLRQIVRAAGVGLDPGALIQAAEHDAPEVRRAARRLLAWRQEPEARPLFLRYLNSESSDREEKMEAAWALAAQKDPAGVAYLHDEFQKQSPGEQIRLAVILAGLKDAAGYSRVVELAHGSDRKLAAKAIEVLPAFLPLAKRPEVDPIGVLQALVEGQPWALVPVVQTLSSALQKKVICDPRLEGLSEAVTRKAAASEDQVLIMRARVLSLHWSSTSRYCEPGAGTP